jgi:hypothetical protein
MKSRPAANLTGLAGLRHPAAGRRVPGTCRNQETGEAHIYEHGVSEDEVEEVLYRPGDDFPARGGTRNALGQTLAGEA